MQQGYQIGQTTKCASFTYLHDANQPPVVYQVTVVVSMMPVFPSIETFM